MTEETATVARLDYGKPPPGYTVAVDGEFSEHAGGGVTWGWEANNDDGCHGSICESEAEAREDAWEDFKAHNDPPGLCLLTDIATGDDVWWFGADPASGAFGRFCPGEPVDNAAGARAAAWTHHDRRLALSCKVELRAPQGVTLRRGLRHADVVGSPWPRCLTWADEQVVEVERWLRDSIAEMPEVLRG